MHRPSFHEDLGVFSFGKIVWLVFSPWLCISRTKPCSIGSFLGIPDSAKGCVSLSIGLLSNIVTQSYTSKSRGLSRRLGGSLFVTGVRFQQLRINFSFSHGADADRKIDSNFVQKSV